MRKILRIGYDNICPVSHKPCDHETCSPFAECKMSNKQPLQDTPSLPKQEGEGICEICGVPAPDHTPFCKHQEEEWIEATTPPQKDGHYNIITEANCLLISAFQNGEWDYNLETDEMVAGAGMGTADRVVRYRPSTYLPIEGEQEPDRPVKEVPKEILEWIDQEIISHGMGHEGWHGVQAKKVAIATYLKMQQVIQMYVDVADASLTTIDKVRGDLSTANATIETLKQQLFSRTDEDARRESIVTAGLNAANAQIEALQKAHEQLKESAAFRLDAIFARQKEIDALKEELSQARATIKAQQDWHDSHLGGPAI